MHVKPPLSHVVDAPVRCSANSHGLNRKLIDLAAAVVDGHLLLPKQPPSPLQS
jgi:hypothetical protein